MTVQLTRRDALAAVAGAGVVTAGVDVATDGAVREAVMGDEPDDRLPAETRQTLHATATVVYPSEATGIEAFVSSYAAGRIATEPARRSGVVEAAGQLRDAGEAFHDERFSALSSETRDETLQSLGVDTAEPEPDGTIPERIRYYVVNDLLYAFYASPTGGKLVGTPNPLGYPGGYRTALSDDNRRAEPATPRDPTEEHG